MNNLLNKLRGLFLCLAALCCASLAAQSQYMVAVLEPDGKRDVKDQVSVVRNSIMTTISKDAQFRVMDRARIDKMLAEHKIVRDSGLFSGNQARELGKMLGVDFILDSELAAQPDALEVSCQVLDIVTGEVIASESTLVGFPLSSKKIQENCQDMVADLLKVMKRKQPAATMSGGSTGSDSASALLSGLDAEIVRAVKNFRSNAKWNRMKANTSIEVDFSGVNIVSNRQFGSEVFRVSGSYTVILQDENGNESATDIRIEDFTEMNSPLIKKKITGQIKMTEVIRDLLDGFDY